MKITLRLALAVLLVGAVACAPPPTLDEAVVIEADRWAASDAATLQAAAEADDVAAQYELGTRSETGSIGVLRDAGAAMRWYRAAAVHGHAAAAYELGSLLMERDRDRADTLRAYMWLNIAVVNGAGADSDDLPAAVASLRLELMAGRLRNDDPAGLQLATDAARACLASNCQDCDPE